MNEIKFKRSIEFPHLIIYEDGKVYSEKSNKFITQRLSKDNDYIMLTIRVGSKVTTKPVHRLVAETFLELPDNKCIVNHKDKNKFNNQISNLEWISFSEKRKSLYKTKQQKIPKSEETHFAKLTRENIKYIRQNYIQKDKTYGAIPLSKKFNVQPKTIYNIINKKTWI